MWPDLLFSWCCAAEWRWFETLAILRISVIIQCCVRPPLLNYYFALLSFIDDYLDNLYVCNITIHFIIVHYTWRQKEAVVRIFAKFSSHVFRCSRPQRDFAILSPQFVFRRSCDSRHEPVNKAQIRMNMTSVRDMMPVKKRQSVAPFLQTFW